MVEQKSDLEKVIPVVENQNEDLKAPPIPVAIEVPAKPDDAE